jgi:hypothetical protein
MKVGTGGIDMKSIEERETASFKLCPACDAELRKATDNYCRRCGARPNTITGRLFDSHRTLSGARRTNLLPPETADFRQVSGTLVKIVTAGTSASTSANLNNRYARSLLLTLLSIPICLMMVLLAPLDAFAAAKSIIHNLSLRY